MVVFNDQINQQVLQKYGFTGKTGAQYGFQGRAFLQSAPEWVQNAYVQERRSYKGEENYQIPGVAPKTDALADFFKNFTSSFITPPASERAPNVGSQQVQAEVASELSKNAKSREGTIFSNFGLLEKLPTENIKRKTLLGD